MADLLSYTLLILIVLQTTYTVWFLWAMGTSAKSKLNNTVQSGISIIICAKNEADNLLKNLPQILAQQHPDFEVIVVDDASSDDTASILQNFAAKHSQLKIVTIEKDEKRLLPGKKFALSKAVARAKNQLLLLTDADCTPASEHWAGMMTAPLQNGKELVAGYGGYNKYSGWLNKFIRWETIHTFIQFSSYANTGMPYMAVGRNIAYKKTLLLTAQETELWSVLPSGDDDLLIRTTANRNNTTIIAEPDAFTFSEAKNNIKDWLAQKQRHLSTGKLYKRHHRVLLSLYGLSHGLMWLFFLLLLSMGQAHLVMGTMILRCALTWTIWAIAAFSLQERWLILWFPVCDIAWAIYNFALSPYIFFKNKHQWT
jgi:glycosyltransferase involved in cell wall biosynthesis